jgi:hypothetical protein
MSFFTELRRRNVFRVAALYAIGSWLLLQVGDILFGLMGLPDWALRLVLGILMLGFPARSTWAREPVTGLMETSWTSSTWLWNSSRIT